MLHIYRQISAVTRVRPIVIAQKRENASRFAFEPVYTVPKPPTHFLRRFWFRQLLQHPWQISSREVAALRRILDKYDAKLLHIYFGHIAVHLVPLLEAWPGPAVVSFHGADGMVELEKPAYRRATERMLSLVRRVFVRSESLRAAISSLTNDQGKIAVVRTGIPLGQFPFQTREVPEFGAWRLLQAGRLIEKKGLITSLRAYSEFAKVFPRSRFTIAGEGPLLTQLHQVTRQLGVADKVSFTGFLRQEELRELYYASHMFLHPSQTGTDGNQEGVPNSMLEAMATGLPVFATYHGGIPEAIDNGVSGVLVHEQDEVGLARQLIAAAADPIRLSALARAGAESVAKTFEQNAQVQNLEELYLQTIRNSPVF